jgi:ABC-type multidrug transport system fused ATPase/permease subunit
MKNFVRLVRSAWKYRARFALSVGCAAMVAIFWFTELGAVYPLLHILFRSQNPQRWIADTIDSTEHEIRVLRTQVDEIDYVREVWSRDGEKSPELLAHFHELTDLCLRSDQRLREFQSSFGLAGPVDQVDKPDDIPVVKVDVLQLRRECRIAEAKLDEFNKSVDRLRKKNPAQLDYHYGQLGQQIKNARWWLGCYRRAKPGIDRYLPDDSFKTLVILVAFVIVGVAIKGLFMFFQEILVARVMQLTLFDLRNLFFRRTMKMDLASFSDQGSAELMARFTNDMESFGQGLSTLLTKMTREPLRIVTCLGGALLLNWRLTCFAMILVPISAVTTYRVGRIMKRAVRRSLESMSTIYKILQESFQGIKVVKAYTMERRERRRFFLETKNLYKKSIKVAKIDAMSDPVLEMLTLTTVTIALLAGGYLVLYQTEFLTIGFFKLQLAGRPPAIEDLLTFYMMLGGVSDPIRKLSNVHSKLQRAAAAADRICSLMDREPQVVERPGAVILPRHVSAIEFQDVHFGYHDDRPVIQGLSLRVRQGETIALVGPNGCGKSTLMSLVPRFWDVQSGSIRIDGHEIRDVRLRSLRRQIGIVLQETILFQDTIANNIAYGSPDAGRDAIIHASKRAYAHQFIESLPMGYDTVVGERGHGLSGGQRQRLALARAMLRDPSILILDEATSAVDIQDEALIRKAIEEFSRDRTTFLISHSLGSIQFADRIVLLNNGRIEAVGTDQELRRTSPLYRRLHEIHYHRESA